MTAPFSPSGPIPAHQGPPRSAEPVADYVRSQPRPGITPDQRYVVLPVPLLAQLPLPIQQQVVQALAAVHTTAATAPWPEIYRVTAAQWAPISQLDEAGLAEVGLTTELDQTGGVVHRDLRTGRTLDPTDLEMRVAVTATDPLTSH